MVQSRVIEVSCDEVAEIMRAYQTTPQEVRGSEIEAPSITTKCTGFRKSW